MNLVIPEVRDLAALSVADLVIAGRAAIALAGSFEELRAIAAKADALQAFQRAIGAARDAMNAASEIRIRAERRMGEELKQADLAKGAAEPGTNRGATRSVSTTASVSLAEIGISKDQSSRFQQLAAIPDETFDVVVEAHKQADEPISTASVARAADVLQSLLASDEAEVVTGAAAVVLGLAKQIRSERAQVRREQNEELKRQNPTPVVAGKYGCIVIDPPWDMQKIARDVRPNQVAFDYPTMSEDELAAFPLADMAADDCHLFCWTTHKFLLVAARLLERWGFRYVNLMVWHKPGGFQPIGLQQYNCEFIMYGRRGSPKFTETKDFPCAFQAARREHSRKPDAFYATIRRVTDEGRIDVFSREARDGFAQFGNEINKFGDAA